jgi:hypothetical protein
MAMSGSLKELVEIVSELVGKLFSHRGEMMSVYLIVNKDGLTMVPPQHRDKEKSLVIIKDIMKEMKATTYVFVDEAWIVNTKDFKVPEGPPWQHPDREEAVILMAETETETLLGHRDIIRKKGVKATLGPLKIDSSQVFGHMTGLLRQETRH